jgi:DNA-directed RNA polymerase specialized sigma subunit
MEFGYIETVIKEELKEAEVRILSRLSKAMNIHLNVDDLANNSSSISKTPLPDNENYAIALELYLSGGTHSAVAKKLGVSINAVKKYNNWLVKHGYLPVEDAELSEAELKVVDCIYNRKMSLRATANELNCSMTNVVYRRDSAIRKGYSPD